MSNLYNMARWASRLVGGLMVLGFLSMFWMMHGQLKTLEQKVKQAPEAAPDSGASLLASRTSGPWRNPVPEADSPW